MMSRINSARNVSSHSSNRGSVDVGATHKVIHIHVRFYDLKCKWQMVALVINFRKAAMWDRLVNDHLMTYLTQ